MYWCWDCERYTRPEWKARCDECQKKMDEEYKRVNK